MGENECEPQQALVTVLMRTNGKIFVFLLDICSLVLVYVHSLCSKSTLATRISHLIEFL